MKFTAKSSELSRALQTVGSVISTSQSRPILENFLFELSDGQLSITASDGETTLITHLDAEIDGSGKMAVPAKIFQDIIKTFSEQVLEFETIESENGGRGLEIRDMTDSYFIALDHEEEYPDIPEFDAASSISLSSGVLAEALSNTLFATNNDSLRPVMTGVLFQFAKDKTNFVATDSHRLVVYTRNDIQTDIEAEIIIPKRPLAIFKNILSQSDQEVHLEFNENMARFQFANQIWICRLIDGKYPNYAAVIPKENPNTITVNRSLLLSSIKRAALFSSKATHQVRFRLNEKKFNLCAEDTEYANRADMTIPCSYEGENINIGFSSKFLSEMLSVLSSEDVYIRMSTPTRPGILEPADGLEQNESILMLSMPVIGV